MKHTVPSSHGHKENAEVEMTEGGMGDGEQEVTSMSDFYPPRVTGCCLQEEGDVDQVMMQS